MLEHRLPWKESKSDKNSADTYDTFLFCSNARNVLVLRNIFVILEKQNHYNWYNTLFFFLSVSHYTRGSATPLELPQVHCIPARAARGWRPWQWCPAQTDRPILGTKYYSCIDYNILVLICLLNLMWYYWLNLSFQFTVINWTILIKRQNNIPFLMPIAITLSWALRSAVACNFVAAGSNDSPSVMTTTTFL